MRLTTLLPSCAVVMKFGNLNFLEPSGPLQAFFFLPLCRYVQFRSYFRNFPIGVYTSTYPSFFQMSTFQDTVLQTFYMHFCFEHSRRQKTDKALLLFCRKNSICVYTLYHLLPYHTLTINLCLKVTLIYQSLLLEIHDEVNRRKRSTS